MEEIDSKSSLISLDFIKNKKKSSHHKFTYIDNDVLPI